eukprot:TRINITY_DN2767_c0_g1_i3.p1 TRINITY_DN2767_c0_g1~~TRINITY_DN2767_c0_g1_i3.p1  ORF type:complete len:352 (-),score=96.12 TRINITY_DN2767_c0_g1_i3:907-1926(-)
MEEEVPTTNYAPFVVRGTPYMLESVWSKEGVTLRVTDGEKVWNGHVKTSEILAMIKQSKVHPQTYLQRMREALTEQDKSGTRAKYTFELEKEGKVLSVKWNIHCGTPSVQQGPAPLLSVQGGMKLNLEPNCKTEVLSVMDRLLTHNARLTKANAELNARNDELTRQRADALALADRATEEKQQNAGLLLQRFVAVLNEKKSYIRKLQDDIDTLRRNPAARAASPVPDQVKPTPAAITAASARRKRAAPSAATTTTAAAVVTTTTTTTAHPVTTTQGGAQQPQQQQQPQQHRVPVASLMQELTTVPSTMVLATPAQTIQTMEPAAAAPAATQERGRPRYV